MRWRRDWPERQPRPKVKKLSEEEKAKILKSLENGIHVSPVLTALHYRIRSLRGRFYYEQFFPDSGDVDVIARVTPLVTPHDVLLLETEYQKGNWKTVVQGKIRKITTAISGDTRGTFHGLGDLDKSLRAATKSHVERLTLLRKAPLMFCYADSDSECGVQEILFHYFGIPIAVIAEPREWYAYHRRPHIREIDHEEQKILVDFLATSGQGETFGGTCLYLKKEDEWMVFTIKPNQSATIQSSVAWLKKRHWKGW